MKNLRLVLDHILAQKINLMKLTIVKIMLCVFVLNIFAGVTEAQTPKRLLKRGRGRRTHLRRRRQGLLHGQRPIKQKGKYKVRGQPYALVTNRPSKKLRAG